MVPKIILLVCDKRSRNDFSKAMKEALAREKIPCAFAWCETYRQGIDYVNGTGFPDFIVVELNAGDTNGGITLLRHVRDVGKPTPVIIWNARFTQDEARQIAELNGINIAWHQPRALFRLSRYATMLLRGQPPVHAP